MGKQYNQNYLHESINNMNWSETKNKIHTLHGITDNPELYEFERKDGVYCPSHKKQFKAIWEPPYYKANIQEVEADFFTENLGYEPGNLDKVFKLNIGHFTYLGYGHFIIRLK